MGSEMLASTVWEYVLWHYVFTPTLLFTLLAFSVIAPCLCRSGSNPRPKVEHPRISSFPAGMHEPMTLRETQTIRRMRLKLKMKVKDIGIATGRGKKAVLKALKRRRAPGTPGRRPILTKQDVARLVSTLKKMIKAAKGMYEISLAMVKQETGLDACEGTLRKALRSQNIRFRRLRSKPRHTAADKKARYAWALKYEGKTKSWWLRNLHLSIDLKNFPVYLNAKARAYAANREVRGAYRQKGQGLDDGYVVVDKSLRFNPGAKSVHIAAGVGKGRVRMWHALDSQWSGQTAADLYKGPMLQALRRMCPSKRKFLVLEDNDPTGFKSRKGEEAKREVGIDILAIPKRSPDLSVCDYALWPAVNRAMRRQELQFAKSKTETRADFIKRLKKTAKGLSTRFVAKSIGDMVRRCRRLREARGGLFEEGGR